MSPLLIYIFIRVGPYIIIEYSVIAYTYLASHFIREVAMYVIGCIYFWGGIIYLLFNMVGIRKYGGISLIETREI